MNRAFLLALAFVAAACSAATTDATKTGVPAVVNLGSLAYASLPTCNSAHNGNVAFANDLGANGTDVRCNGTRWRPINGRVTLKDLGAQVTGVANTENIVIQTLLPAGSWQTNDTLRVYMAGSKSGTTDTFNFNVRIGTAGTTSDTAITGLTGAFLTAASQAGAYIYDVKLLGATSAQRVVTANGYSASTSGGAASATAISSASANALYVSLSINSSGTTNTVSLLGGQIELITP